ncbi:hypothetical protein M8J77_004364 [Diaphorina citri]|nr:hypothetical protein M8J77_004364 [Diaphorina citri]
MTHQSAPNHGSSHPHRHLACHKTPLDLQALGGILLHRKWGLLCRLAASPSPTHVALMRLEVVGAGAAGAALGLSRGAL